jgi:hypothetical protein
MREGAKMRSSQTPMTLLLIILFLALPVAGGLVVLLVARRAPEGYEDEAGFHGFAGSAGEKSYLDLVAESVPRDSGGLLRGGGGRSGSCADA